MSSFSMDSINPYLGIGILAAVSFTLLLLSALLIHLRDRRRNSVWASWRAEVEAPESKPVLNDIWSDPGSLPNLSPQWSTAQPLSTTFIPSLRPVPIQRPKALPRPTSVPRAAQQLPWGTWRDPSKFRVKTKAEIERELKGLDRGSLQMAFKIQMPGADKLDDIWELGTTSVEPWTITDLDDKGDAPGTVEGS